MLRTKIVCTIGPASRDPAILAALMRVHLIERVMARGTGVGDRKVLGRTRRLALPLDPSVRVDSDEIIVTPATDHTFVRVLRRAAGLVTADADPGSHATMLAVELGIPALLGVTEELAALQDGKQVVLDARRGVLFERPEALIHVEE